MPRIGTIRTFVVLAFVAFALTAYADPNLFVSRNGPAGLGGLVVAAMAAGCAVKLTVPLAFFGPHAHVSAPLFLALALPYFARLLLWDTALRTFWRRYAGPRTAPAPPRSAASPYALPARVAVALAAAARARK